MSGDGVAEDRAAHVGLDEEREVLDATIGLLDRQLLGADSAMRGKVDDLLLRRRDDGAYEVAAVLSGPGALWARLGGRYRPRSVVSFDVADVDAWGGQVRLVDGAREGVPACEDAGSGREEMRLSALLGCTVLDQAGTVRGHVNDVRLRRERRPGVPAGVLVTVGVVVSDRHAGSMLGYRDGELTRPRVLAAIVARLLRRAFTVAWADVRDVDLDARRVVVRA
ncbi:MAG: hypothetical protein U0Q15_04260 [Kineosporiaceae bacterium]